MKKLLAFFTLCLALTTAFAHPQDGMSPEDLMRYYFKVFNEGGFKFEAQRALVIDETPLRVF